jgi:hypothetical protein
MRLHETKRKFTQVVGKMAFLGWLIISVLSVQLSVREAASQAAGADAQKEVIWVTIEDDGDPAVHLYYFWTTTCPVCAEASPFLNELERHYSWLRIHRLEVLHNRENAAGGEDPETAFGRHDAGARHAADCSAAPLEPPVYRGGDSPGGDSRHAAHRNHREAHANSRCNLSMQQSDIRPVKRTPGGYQVKRGMPA